MKDSFGREITYLRISVTQRCNLNCVYCGREECEKKEAELTPGEYHALAAAFVSCGINKIRVTGGEPLVRADITEIVELLAGLDGVENLSLTTNGVYLKKYAADLKNAGLRSVNISLDSTDDSVYRHLTGADALRKVMDGIEEAERVGLSPVKINAVLMKDVNSDGAGELIDLAKNRPTDIRFIELMPFSASGEKDSLIVTGEEILRRFPFLVPMNVTEGTASYYTAPGFRGRVGLISPVSRKFCKDCNRIRLLSDGKVRPCLGYEDSYDLMPFIGDREKLVAEIEKIIRKKPAGHDFDSREVRRGLNRTGG